MIFTALILVITDLLNFIVAFFPSSTGFPAEAHTAMQGLGGYLGIFSPILPLSTLFTILTLVLTVEVSIFGFKTFKWLISHIPQIGGKGNT